MVFQIGDQSARFQEEPHLSDAEISKSGLRKLMAKGDIAYFCHLQGDQPGTMESKMWPELIIVLKEFEGVAAEPGQLPPERNTNHRINLVLGSQPVNMRPYRFPHYLKSEIEKFTTEMLN